MVDFGEYTKKKVFEDTTWLAYLLCGGRGIGAVTPLVLSDVKQLCLHTQAGTAEIGGEQGLCNGASTCLCISEHFSIPPAQDTYPCIICGKEIGEKRTTGKVATEVVYKGDDLFKKPFWVYYLFCLGCGVHKPLNGMPLVGSQFKELCCAGSTQLESPKTNGVFCTTLGTFLCCWDECQMPPAADNPKLACCSWKLNKTHDNAPNSAPGAPEPEVKVINNAQQAMT
jgi:hypothetical protein